MMDEILCTNCGTPNRRDQEVCSFCQSPLQPIASKDRLRPGLAPTEKSTSELEPLLPDWLRQAREAARSTAPEAPKEPPPEPTIPEPASSPDLPDWLAGLEAISQEEEEELPDWLRGELASPPTEATPPGLSFQEPVPPAQSLDELGGVAPIAGPATGEEDLMAWLQTSEEETPESFDVTSDWLSRLEGSSALPSDETTVQPSVEEPATPPATGELLDWLNQITAESAPASPTVTTEETPSPDVSPFAVTEGESLDDWFSGLGRAGEPPVSATETGVTAGEPAFDLPDWLKSVTETSAPEGSGRVSVSPEPPSASDWMVSLETRPASTLPPEATSGDVSLPDWLSQFPETATPSDSSATESLPEAGFPAWMQPESAGAGAPPFGAETPSGVEEEAAVPDWLQQAAGAGVPPFGAETPPGVEEEAAIPEWLQQAAGAGVPPFGAETPSGVEEEAAVPPDWLGAFASQETPTTPPVVSTEMPHAPAFVFSEEAQPAIEEDLFSLQMPDWLSGITPADEAKTLAEEQVLAEGLAPAELPSWVQAMRPVETVLPGEPAMPVEEGPVEVSGPLAGLRGVLPPIEKIVSSKPRPQGLLLQASEAQQADAQLLEQLLLEEAQSRPIPGSPILASQRTLRWALAAVLLLVVLAVQLLGLRLIPLPMGVPIENERAIRVLDALPTNASVLMVFDYQPALAGEIEAVGVPFVDRLLGLRSPNITALSTSPVGMALAQRFMTHLQRRYPSLDERFIRLGYLPGGAMGIRAFALHPRLALPSDLWQHPTLQSVKQFSDYDAVILLTDQAGIARSWIEQTSDQSQGRFLVVIASTQAAPPIQPYVLSGQVDGLLSGLAVGAAFEASTNSGGPVGAYWDAYQGALLLSAVLILAGGIVSLVEQAREHYPFQKAKP